MSRELCNEILDRLGCELSFGASAATTSANADTFLLQLLRPPEVESSDRDFQRDGGENFRGRSGHDSFDGITCTAGAITGTYLAAFRSCQRIRTAEPAATESTSSCSPAVVPADAERQAGQDRRRQLFRVLATARTPAIRRLQKAGVQFGARRRATCWLKSGPTRLFWQSEPSVPGPGLVRQPYLSSISTTCRDFDDVDF